MAQRTRQYNLRINDEEQARLRALAAHHELTEAALLRWLLKREADAVLGGPRK
jgi:predicted DNA-binding protein